MRQLILNVEEPGENVERAVDLAWDLKATLDESPVESVGHPVAESPADAKPGTAYDWAQLVIGFSGGLPAVLGLVRQWRSRNRGTRITVELDGDKLVLEAPGDEEERQLVDAFLQRHEGD